MATLKNFQDELPITFSFDGDKKVSLDLVDDRVTMTTEVDGLGIAVEMTEEQAMRFANGLFMFACMIEDLKGAMMLPKYTIPMMTFVGIWKPVGEGHANPPGNTPILLVTCENVLRSLGKPAFMANVGYYKAEEDIFSLYDDDLIHGLVVFWSAIPELPCEAIATWERWSAKHDA